MKYSRLLRASRRIQLSLESLHGSIKIIYLWQYYVERINKNHCEKEANKHKHKYSTLRLRPFRLISSSECDL